MPTTSPMRYPEGFAETERPVSTMPPSDVSAAPATADARLRAQVIERLSQTSLRHLGIRIEVQGGLVRLCGTLRDPKLRTHAEWLVFTTAGVHAVCSDWQITPDRAPFSPH
ncbi:MAG: BON domain-containing protein [Thiomonas sp.]|uniref:BON domain-containing protein n=1 Tax=Thiomonas sp. TaxID=2047785 RepID=UPI002A35F20E|nr:BON domain-containing protein [Thiomonas sp.]MDY0330637.1 BON domain-containing protein [Thiomonas sp.]